MTNNNNLSGDYEVPLKINNKIMETKWVTVAGKSSQTVEFTTSQKDLGTYTVAINSLSGIFTVKESVALSRKPVNWWLVGGLILLCIMIAGGVFFLVKRRNASGGVL